MRLIQTGGVRTCASSQLFHLRDHVPVILESAGDVLCGGPVWDWGLVIVCMGIAGGILCFLPGLTSHGALQLEQTFGHLCIAGLSHCMDLGIHV